jgi:hypothetical protein
LGDGETGSQRSPGACDSLANTGHLLREGVSGTFSGSFTITMASGHTYSSGQGCSSTEPATGAPPPTTAAPPLRGSPTPFRARSTYGTSANVTAYSLTYHANRQQWIDANTGDSGDIFTSGS